MGLGSPARPEDRRLPRDLSAAPVTADPGPVPADVTAEQSGRDRGGRVGTSEGRLQLKDSGTTRGGATDPGVTGRQLSKGLVHVQVAVPTAAVLGSLFRGTCRASGPERWARLPRWSRGQPAHPSALKVRAPEAPGAAPCPGVAGPCPCLREEAKPRDDTLARAATQGSRVFCQHLDAVTKLTSHRAAPSRIPPKGRQVQPEHKGGQAGGAGSWAESHMAEAWSR